jgi:hypothetical protein
MDGRPPEDEGRALSSGTSRISFRRSGNGGVNDEVPAGEEAFA